MVNKRAIASYIAALGLALGIASSQAVAQMPREGMQHSQSEHTNQFRRIEQPLWLKGAVTAGGLGLIGLELWWFLLSKPKSRQATTQGGIQEVTVSRIEIQASSVDDSRKASALHSADMHHRS